MGWVLCVTLCVFTASDLPCWFIGGVGGVGFVVVGVSVVVVVIVVVVVVVVVFLHHLCFQSIISLS